MPVTKKRKARKTYTHLLRILLGYCSHHFHLHPTDQNLFTCLISVRNLKTVSLLHGHICNQKLGVLPSLRRMVMSTAKCLLQTLQLLLPWFFLFSILLAIVFPKAQSLVLYSFVSISAFWGLSHHVIVLSALMALKSLCLAPTCLSVWSLHLDGYNIKPIIF